MATSALNEIENEFARLSPEAQLSLLERLVHQTRLSVAGHSDAWDAGVCAMAADPEIQQELSRINAEFRAAETDMLGAD